MVPPSDPSIADMERLRAAARTATRPVRRLSLRQTVAQLRPEITHLRQEHGMTWREVATWLSGNGITIKPGVLKAYFFQAPPLARSRSGDPPAPLPPAQPTPVEPTTSVQTGDDRPVIARRIA